MNEKIKQTMQLLDDHGFVYDTVDDAFEDDNVVKTIVFKKKSSDEPFAVAVKKDDRVSYKKIRTLVDDTVSPLSPEELEELGWVPGECCPLTINCELFVDQSVLELDEVHSGSGDKNYGIIYSLDALHDIRSDMHVVDARED